MLVLLFAGVAAAVDASVAYAFEPTLLTLRVNDRTLRDYGFTPVGSPLLLTHGVRGRLRYDDGVTVGMAMAMAFTARPGDPVPTTTTFTRLAYTVGACIDDRWTVEGDVGFASLTHAVGSDVQGGALVYLGPWLQPRVGVIAVGAPAHLEVQLGYGVQVPVGVAHRNPLWEDPFRRRVVHGPALALVVGAGT